MAGILYLIRLYIYHRERGVDSKEIHSVFTVMEYKLYRYITVPAAYVAWACGLGISYLMPNYWQEGWFHGKVLSAIFLTVATWYSGRLRLKFKDKIGPLPTSKQLRFFNEVPTILMMIIVWFVIYRPFS